MEIQLEQCWGEMLYFWESKTTTVRDSLLSFSLVNVVIVFAEATIGFQFLLSSADEQDVDFTHNLLVTRDVDSEQNYSIALSGSPNTAEDDDFFVSDDTFYFPPDVSSINVSVTIRGDTRIELAETFDVRLRQRGGPNFVVDPLTRNIIVEIRDNDGGWSILLILPT